MKVRAEFDVIVRPVVTEKSTDEGEQGKYVFEVRGKATKVQIRQAVEHIFKTHVVAVNTTWMRGKKRRRGNRFGTTEPWKKAIVQLKPGEHIEFFEKA